MRILKALVVFLLASFPLLSVVHCLEVDSPDVVEENGAETQPWRIPSKTEQLIRRKKEALKLLFNSTDRKVPIIYNRNSDLFQQYLSARFTRKPDEDDASSESPIKTEDRTERNFDITTLTSWRGPDESLDEQLVNSSKARRVTKIKAPHLRARKKSQKMIDIDSNPPFEQQDFAAYVTLRTETDLEAAPAKRSSSNPVRDELRSFIQQLQSLDDFESVKLSTILPQESNSVSKEAEQEEFEEDTSVKFFHNGAEDPGLRGQFVISEAVPTAQLRPAPTKSTAYEYNKERIHENTYKAQFRDEILPERIQTSFNFQRSAQPRPTQIPSLQGSLIHPTEKGLAHEHNQASKDGKVKLDKIHKLTNVVQIGGTLYRSPNPTQAHPTPPSNSFSSTTSHHSHNLPTITTPRPVQSVEPNYGPSFGSQSQQSDNSYSQPIEDVSPNFEFQVSQSPPRSYSYEADSTLPPAPEGISPSSGVLYREGFGTTPNPFVIEDEGHFSTKAPIFSYQHPQRLTTPKYYMQLVTDQPYTPKPVSITIPPTPSPPPPIIYEDQQPDIPTSSPIYYKPLPSVQGFLIHDSSSHSKPAPSFKSHQSPPSYSRPSEPKDESSHTHSDSVIESEISYSDHPPTPKFVKHISASSPYHHGPTKTDSHPPGYNKDVENTTPYPLVYGFKPVVNRS